MYMHVLYIYILHVYALDVSTVPMLVPKAERKPKELAILQLKAAWKFYLHLLVSDRHCFCPTYWNMLLLEYHFNGPNHIVPPR